MVPAELKCDIHILSCMCKWLVILILAAGANINRVRASALFTKNFVEEVAYGEGTENSLSKPK